MATTAATTPEAFIAALPDDRKNAVAQLRQTLQQHLPAGFKETMNYGMISYVVPHEKYPAGYHCDPKLPLPFISISNTKGHIGLHHIGLYSNPELLDWFTSQYPYYSKIKLDMGKGCVRFKKPEAIPYELVAKLAQRVDPDQWIAWYEQNLKNR